MKVYYNSLNEPYSSSHETTKTSQRSTLQLANIWTRCPTQCLSLDSYSDTVLDRNKTCSHKENMWSINYPLVLLTISILSFFHGKKNAPSYSGTARVPGQAHDAHTYTCTLTMTHSILSCPYTYVLNITFLHTITHTLTHTGVIST